MHLCYMKPYSEQLARRSAGIPGEHALISRPLERHVETSSTEAHLSVSEAFACK